MLPLDDDLLHGSGSGLLVFQAVGVLALTFGALRAVGQLRVDPDWELEGLDLHEHGVPGYP